VVDTKNLTVTLTTGDEQEREEAERREQRKRQLAIQNTVPEWYTSTYDTGSGNGVAVGGIATAASDEDDDDAEDNDDEFEDVEVGGISGIKREHSVAFEGDSDDNEDFEDV
jgi:hypothetical protein